MEVYLKNSLGVIKTATVGFSWKILFFGIFLPLFQWRIKWFFITLMLAFITFGLVWVVLPFIYNKLYIKDLIKQGYKAANIQTKNMLASKGIFVDVMSKEEMIF